MKKINSGSPWTTGEYEVGEDELLILTTRAELATMAGAINEALEAVEEWEFETRMGVTASQARALREQIIELLQSTYRPQ